MFMVSWTSAQPKTARGVQLHNTNMITLLIVLKIFFCYASKYVCIDFLFTYFVCDVKYIVNSPATVNMVSSFGNSLNFLDGYFSVMSEILISRMLTFLAECRTIMKYTVKIVVKNVD